MRSAIYLTIEQNDLPVLTHQLHLWMNTRNLQFILHQDPMVMVTRQPMYWFLQRRYLPMR
jgi:hypothetical protein